MVDALIRLFPSTTTNFSTIGIGVLIDAISCIVIEERNGSFELEMKYPITGQYYDELSLRRIIVTKSNPFSKPQAFRIFQISRPINGIVTVEAQHISYDLIGYPVKPFSATGIVNALNGLKNNSVVAHPFSFSTDKQTGSIFTLINPIGTKTILGGVEGSFLDIYGGEYEFDNFEVKLWNSRGTNRGVYIRYGKNLTNLEQEENCSNVYTGVYPYWYSQEQGLVELSGQKYIEAEGTYDFQRILALDLSYEFETKPTVAQLRSKAETYMKNNDIGVPKVSLTVSFVQLAQSKEYEEFAALEQVHLCDTVNVEFLELNVRATSKCISTTYNVLTNKYDSIELGEAKSTLATTIADTQTTANSAANISSVEKSQTQANIDRSGMKVTGQLGGNILIRDSTGNDMPDQILIMDTTNVDTALNIWKWDKNGLSYSKDGYSGPWVSVDDKSVIGEKVLSVITDAEIIDGELKITKEDIKIQNGRILV